jgi:hypothetical protein
VIPLVEAEDTASLGIWVEVSIGQEFPDRPNGWAVLGRDRDKNIRMMVEENLPASTARRNQPPPSVTSSGNSQKLLCSRSGRNSQGNEFSARAAGEVVDIHGLVNSSVNIHCRRSNSVIVVVSQASRQGLRCINDTALSVNWFHN